VIYVQDIRKDPLQKNRALAESTRTAKRPHHRSPPLVKATSALQGNELVRRNRLVLEHLRLAKTIAINIHKKLPVHVDVDDLVQTGVIGLFDAANKFDAGRQDVFPRYAKHRIKGAILDSLRQLDWASRDIRRKHKQVYAAKHDLAMILQRVPTEAEVAEKLNMDVERLRAMMLDLENIGPISADTRANQGDDLPAPELPGRPETQPDFICARKEMCTMLGKAITALPERYQRVLLLYYTQELTMKAIGAMLGVNESRISQVHKSALAKMAITLHNHGVDCIQAFQN
jgi:RNA polymerase sigma factor for flagellar operon FliA